VADEGLALFSFFDSPLLGFGSIIQVPKPSLWEDYMKLIAATFAALFLAALSLSIPAPIFTTVASADRMNGKATCGQMVCMQDRYYAAKAREAKTKKPK
jgi:hypothetical protein